MERKERLWPWAVGLLISSHVAGLVGLNWPAVDQWLAAYTPIDSFAQLTPFNLLLTAGLLFYYQRTWDRRLLLFMAISFGVGFFVEVVGVATGAIFGTYYYGEVMGPKKLDVPLLMGLNWVVLTYASGSVVQLFWKRQIPENGRSKSSDSLWLKCAIAALLMVLIDVIIEPVAIKLEFWIWEGNSVPFQNYVAWYVIALPLCWLFFYAENGRFNRMAPYVYLVQFLFFGLQLFI